MNTRNRIRNVHPGYNSILVSFDPLISNHSELEKFIRGLLQQNEDIHIQNRIVEIPTCYGGEFGSDLDEVSHRCGLAANDVIRLHSSAEYIVYFLGFSPGFPYLGGLPPELSVPRLSVPRTRVPTGSVAIAGKQAGVYPVSSPGGWRIIGRTPLKLFEPSKEPPTLLQIGDYVKFVPITETEFQNMSIA